MSNQSKHYQGFMARVKQALPDKPEDSLTELFYAMELFKSQYKPTDGNFEEYLLGRLNSYLASQGMLAH
jgi:hypothetical protein